MKQKKPTSSHRLREILVIKKDKNPKHDHFVMQLKKLHKIEILILQVTIV